MTFKSISIFALLTVSIAAQAQVAFTGQNSPNSNNPLPMPAWGVFSTGGDVQVSIQSFDFNGGPGYNDNVLMAGTSLGNLQTIGTNYQFGTSIDLGTISAGTEIILAMTSQQGPTYYSGSNSVLNSDGYNHTDLYSTAGGTVVDFEDLSGLGNVYNSDWNYGDAKLFVSNSQAMATPEPLPVAVLGVGVLGLVIRRKRA